MNRRPPAAPLGSGPTRAARLRAPLLLALGITLAFEAAGGLWLFAARLLVGSSPGVALHVGGGLALNVLYAAYQWGHWRRVRPFRARLDHALGLIAALAIVCTQLSGLWLGALWWRSRAAGIVDYPPLLSAAHNIFSMLVLTFTGAHLGAVLMRDRSPAR